MKASAARKLALKHDYLVKSKKALVGQIKDSAKTGCTNTNVDVPSEKSDDFQSFLEKNGFRVFVSGDKKQATVQFEIEWHF